MSRWASNRINGPFGLNDAGSERQPFRTAATFLGASSAGTDDVIGIANNIIATGDYTGITGSNPGYLWGQNVFTTTGTGTTDGNGITNLYGGLVETSIRSGSGASLGTVTGFMAETAFMGATAGATVTTMMSLRVGAPKRKDGATAGTATTAYGLFVEAVPAGTVGATTAYSLYVQSGTSFFGGPVTVNNQNVAAGSGTVSARNALFGRVDQATAGRMTVYADTAGNDVLTVRGFTAQTTDLIRAQRTTDGTNWTTVFGIQESGNLRINNSATVPAANNASGGYLYAEGGALKWRGSAGTVSTIAPA